LSPVVAKERSRTHSADPALPIGEGVSGAVSLSVFIMDVRSRRTLQALATVAGPGGTIPA
jgi:hypothetical protein